MTRLLSRGQTLLAWERGCVRRGAAVGKEARSPGEEAGWGRVRMSGVGGRQAGLVPGPGHTYLISAAGHPCLGTGYPRRSDDPGWRPGAWVPRRTTRSLCAGAGPGPAGETVGTQGGDSFPSGGPAKATVPQATRVPLCQVPHGAGDGPAPAEMPPNPTRLKAPYHSLMWIIHQFGVISEAFTSQLTSPGHPEFSSLATMRSVLRECKSI